MTNISTLFVNLTVLSCSYVEKGCRCLLEKLTGRSVKAIKQASCRSKDLTDIKELQKAKPRKKKSRE